METQWISVTEKLPEAWSMFGGCSDNVFVHYKRKDSFGEIGAFAIGHYCRGKRWRALIHKQGFEYGYEDVNVDYWMPIPSIPKGGEQ